MCSGKSKRCPVSQAAPSSDWEHPCGPPAVPWGRAAWRGGVEHWEMLQGWAGASGACPAGGYQRSMAQNAVWGRIQLASKFIRETLTREGDNLQKIHKKQWSSEALKPKNSLRIPEMKHEGCVMWCLRLQETECNGRGELWVTIPGVSLAWGTVMWPPVRACRSEGLPRRCPGCHRVPWPVCTVILLCRTGERCYCWDRAGVCLVQWKLWKIKMHFEKRSIPGVEHGTIWKSC